MTELLLHHCFFPEARSGDKKRPNTENWQTTSCEDDAEQDNNNVIQLLISLS
jgi:hypothetical protein